MSSGLVVACGAEQRARWCLVADGAGSFLCEVVAGQFGSPNLNFTHVDQS